MNDIGIVMPVYNQVPEFLRDAIQSILHQSYIHFHFVIVIDGASNDTITIVEDETKDDARTKIIYKKKNEGVAKALNTGFEYLMELSDIKYFTWVSSDNIYYQEFLEKLRDSLHNGPPELGLVYSSFRHVDENGHLMKDHPDFEAFHQFQEQPKEYLIDACFIGVSFMYKKIYAQKIEGYVMEPVEDYEYWLRLTEECEIKYVKNILMDYRVDSPKSISTQLRNSVEKNQRWRYFFNLARQQARNRRKIPFEITILYPVKDGSQETIAKLESVYNQYFSNFKVLIIDISPNSTATPLLAGVSDPRVAFLKFPNISELEAIKIGAKSADTLFTIIVDDGCFPSSDAVLLNLTIFRKQLEAQFQVISTFDDGEGKVSYKTSRSPLEPLSGQLYKTATLLNILNES
ncbi:glycosyltransferase family 2 protein [Bacillus sp. CRN 9]|uniref:glycosyltransferase n=1 Tax=Cytobacillus horneckiae TaxID=549687 RepID=UPI001562C2CD|nr:glycosyltransferase family 2 protein [Bacillus sp. CRN 9]